MQNAISMYSMWRCTPGSNLTHLAPQDNFSLMPNCSLGPPEYERKCSKKYTHLGYVKMHGYHGNPYCNFYGCGGGGTYKFNLILADTYHILPN